MFHELKNLINTMALVKKENLCLVEIKEINFKDKVDGSDVKKFKYTFLRSDNTTAEYYADEKKYAERVINTDAYDSAKSAEYSFAGRAFDGVIKWTLQI